MPLSDLAIRNAKPSDKPLRLFDGGGLYLEVAPSGGKWWRLKYRFDGKEKRFSLGVYPDVSLAEARKRRDIARQKLATGIDPGEAKKAEKRTSSAGGENSFEAVAREWHEKFKPTWSENHGDRILRRLEVDAFPWIGSKSIERLTAPDVLDIVRRVEKRNALETAHRLLGNVGQVCRYAVATARAERDITTDLRGALPPAEEEHFAALTDPNQLGELLRAIDGYQGTFVVKCALQLSPMLFQRPGELRLASWPEFDLDASQWEIPGERMKRKKRDKQTGGAHIVPLPSQAVTILRELQALTGRDRYVFSGARDRSRPMSNNTINAALRRLGYNTQEDVTGHGFRATARTIMDEGLGIPPAVVEAQLAHAVKDPLGRAYNRTKFLAQRKEMMQRWADYLDQLKAGAKILPIQAIG